MLSADTALVHLWSSLRVPAGPMAGEMETVPSAVMVRHGAEWRIAAFHNTMVAPPPAMHNNGQTSATESRS